MLKTLISLCLIGGVCGTLLALTNNWTRADIQLNRQAQARMVATSLLGNDLPNSIDLGSLPAGDCSNWLLFEVSAQGYTAEVNFLALWTAQTVMPAGASKGAGHGTATISLRTTRHYETPGIGDFIDHTKDGWLPDRDRTPVQRLDDIDIVTGATITSLAVINAANQAHLAAQKHCE